MSIISDHLPVANGDNTAARIQHRPITFDDIRAAAQRMRDEGHSDFVVANAIGVSVEALRRLLGCVECDT